ncbi:Trihelix transcription factor GT-3b [Hibiscus syriacus]|uniref:Trihelix transcription factor GT-3b n=1 Tax=Hibiscus syriacus TaxID=106335 RepID=A0A6A2ZLI2_HIBSY|nr:trihelix transcription factor GT-3b-like [Hibiscus syriacus]XP_039013055.1 trihelix transcription factor GT-3b-like [Hibiscus syriacus]KAE8692894.1 Trihelix transcription factor GT-3b [Hibiscus syriacus]
MEGSHHRRHHLQQKPVSANVEASDRFPQWSVQETRDFLAFRAELDQSFMETKRNKLLWEVISTRMRENGYNRSAEQCKCKWKNLVTRFKACGTIESEAARQQFLFYDELRAIFMSRMQSIQCSESEGGGGTAASRKRSASASTVETGQLCSDEEEDMVENELDKKYSIRKKKKQAKTGSTSGGNNNNNIKEMLEDFMRQQLQMEMQWSEALESRENERRSKQMEWRQAMEALENERIMMERRWREREEQRRMREEARAEKRDALINALLNKL